MPARGRVVVLVVPSHWERALLRAELIERGHEAFAAEDLGDPELLGAPPEDSERVGVVVLDRAAVAGKPDWLLVSLRSRYHGAAFVLLDGAGAAAGGTWDAVLRRPISVGDVARAVDAALARRPPAGR